MSESIHPQNAFTDALRRGDPAELRVLLDDGADLHGADEDGYTALLRAAHGNKTHLLQILQLLVDRGAELNGISRYGESALRVLSNAGRFDAVRLLLDAGADESQLEWNPLIRAVALGTLADMQAAWQALRSAGGSLEARDRWKRTAWLVAVQTGDVAKARWLADQGADTTARGHCGKPPLFYAIEGHHTPMLHWLLDCGHDIELTDDFEGTPLMQAASCGHDDGIRLLAAAGAQLERLQHGDTALGHATHAPQARLLLALGADPARLSAEARRDLLGLPLEPDVALLAGVTPPQFKAARTRRFGRRNGEKMNEAFWLAMIRAGVSAYGAVCHFDGQRRSGEPPVWCAQRFGQSITFLPDGRIVQVAGEHEDSYDPDFCIYNDVFVHHPDGRIDIHGYPDKLFPPTDFHTATLVGNGLILIGSLGYSGQRAFGSTPVFSLSLTDLRMQRLDIAGTPPGWIYKHRAQLSGPRQITVSGGTVARMERKEVHEPNTASFVLDLEAQAWRSGD
jgi:ankyrin repeat protein